MLYPSELSRCNLPEKKQDFKVPVMFPFKSSFEVLTLIRLYTTRTITHPTTKNLKCQSLITQTAPHPTPFKNHYLEAKSSLSRLQASYKVPNRWGGQGKHLCWKHRRPYLIYFNREKIGNILVLSLSKSILKEYPENWLSMCYWTNRTPQKHWKQNPLRNTYCHFPLTRWVLCNELKNKTYYFDTKYKNKISNGN